MSLGADRIETIKKLKYALDPVNQIDDICNTYLQWNEYLESLLYDLQFHKPGLRFGCATILITVSIGTLISWVLTITLTLINLEDRLFAVLFSELVATLLSLLLSLIVLVLSYGLPFLLIYIMNKRSEKLFITSTNEKIDNANHNIHLVVQHLKSKYLENEMILNQIPDIYLNVKAIGHLIFYLESGKADNFKEAMNLYDLQLHHWRVENGISDENIKQKRREELLLKAVQLARNSRNFTS